MVSCCGYLVGCRPVSLDVIASTAWGFQGAVLQDRGVTDLPDPTNAHGSGDLGVEPSPALPISPSAALPEVGAVPVAPRTDGSAVAALVIAILSWFLLPLIGSVIALVLAGRAEQSIGAAPLEVTGRGLATAARWVAWTHLVVVAMVIAFVSAFAIAVWIGR